MGKNGSPVCFSALAQALRPPCSGWRRKESHPANLCRIKPTDVEKIRFPPPISKRDSYLPTTSALLRVQDGSRLSLASQLVFSPLLSSHRVFRSAWLRSMRLWHRARRAPPNSDTWSRRQHPSHATGLVNTL